jgi:hypothetical protein
MNFDTVRGWGGGGGVPRAGCWAAAPETHRRPKAAHKRSGLNVVTEFLLNEDEIAGTRGIVVAAIYGSTASRAAANRQTGIFGLF